MLISSVAEEFLFCAWLVSFCRSGMLFDLLHVWLVMVFFGMCWSFVAYGYLLAFFFKPASSICVISLLLCSLCLLALFFIFVCSLAFGFASC